MADQVQIDPAEARRQVVAQLREMADHIEAHERHISGFNVRSRRYDAYNIETIIVIDEIPGVASVASYLEAGGR